MHACRSTLEDPTNALGALHAAHIVHRDVKPSNLFVHRNASGRITPKLLDFGVAKALRQSGLTLSGTALGTPAYMSPEQALGYGRVGPATDVWSMAVVWFRCLTLSLPFAERGCAQDGAVRSVLEEPELGAIPRPLARVFARALRFEPSERFTTMEEFREALSAALTQLDAAIAWPGEETVGYAAAETELARLIAPEVSLGPVTTERAGSNDSAERVTRTLSGIGVASRPRNRALSTAVLAASALVVAGASAAVFSNRPPATPPGRALPSPSSAVVPPLDSALAAQVQPDDLVDRVRQAGRAVANAVPPGRPERARSPTRGGGAPAAASPAAAMPASPALEPADSPSAGTDPTATPASQPRRGANRAPIIE